MRVARSALTELADELAAIPAATTVVVSDERVAELYGAEFVADLHDRGLDAHLATFPEGERSKTRATKAGLEDRLAVLGAGRDTRIVAVGGGVTGDLAGFLAATWHRGVPWVQVPTSLLAMVDAAIGGKTAVDTPAAKNLVGAFHQPESVWADPAVLATLPASAIRHGLAEALKTAVACDARLFRMLERSSGPLAGGSPDALEPVVVACMRRKGVIVTRDEREAGPRAALNFGHTVAHGLEAASGWQMAHGDAVALGIAVEIDLAMTHTGFPREDRARVLELLRALGMRSKIPAAHDLDATLIFAQRDKKNRAGRIRCALPERLGRMPEGDAITTEVDRDALARALAAYRG